MTSPLSLSVGLLQMPTTMTSVTDSGNSTNASEVSPEMSAAEKAGFIVGFSAITLVGLAGNLVVIYTIAGNARMRSVTNYFILNLACSDFLMAGLCVPFGFVSNVLLPYWPFGALLCPIVTYAQTVTVFLSAFTLVAISFDRYVAIIFPLKQRLRTRHAFLIIGVIWILALGVSLPVALQSGLEEWGEPSLNLVRCGEIHWRDAQQKSVYSSTIMVLQYFVPLWVLLITYTHIGFVVWLKKMPGEAESSRDKRMMTSKRKMIKMMITVVIIYALCWLPLHVITIVADHHPLIWFYDWMRPVWIACYWLAMSTCCYNPIVYCWMNSKYRNGFRYAFRFVPCVTYDRDRHDPNRANRIRTYVSSKKTSTSSLMTNSTQRRSNDPPTAGAHLCSRSAVHRGKMGTRGSSGSDASLPMGMHRLTSSSNGGDVTQVGGSLYTYLGTGVHKDRRFSAMSACDFTDDDD